MRKLDEVVAAEELAVGILPLDRAEGRRRGEERRTPCCAITRQNAPGVRRADRLALVQDRGAAVEQRPVDDVGVAHDPADVRGGPEHLAGLDAVDVLHLHLSATAWPPLSRTTPLGLPVVPEV